MKKKIISIIVIIIAVIAIIGGYFWLMKGEEGTDGVLKEGSNNKVLVVYYSYSGTTKRVAEHLQELTNGDIYDIQPETKYSEDSNVATARLMAERASNNMPKLMGDLPDISKYDLILIGTPVWNSDIANPVMSYLQENNFEGKKVAPFWTYITNEGQTEESYKKLVKNGEVLQGLSLSSANSYSSDRLNSKLSEWLNVIK